MLTVIFLSQYHQLPYILWLHTHCRDLGVTITFKNRNELVITHVNDQNLCTEHIKWIDNCFLLQCVCGLLELMQAKGIWIYNIEVVTLYFTVFCGLFRRKLASGWPANLASSWQQWESGCAYAHAEMLHATLQPGDAVERDLQETRMSKNKLRTIRTLSSTSHNVVHKCCRKERQMD